LEQNQKGHPTMKRQHKMRTPDHTRLNLGQEKYYCPFIEGYIKILQTNLKQIKHIGHNYNYRTYTCGEPHDERKPNWKPFRLLWDYFERKGYDFFVARDIIFERLGRKLICECEMLRDDKKLRRLELEKMFGVDFGESGRRGLDLV
jgi:hypothetical protein